MKTRAWPGVGDVVLCKKTGRVGLVVGSSHSAYKNVRIPWTGKISERENSGRVVAREPRTRLTVLQTITLKRGLRDLCHCWPSPASSVVAQEVLQVLPDHRDL